MALQGTDPALVGDDHGDRLALDEGLLDRGKIVLGRVRKGAAALAERRLRSEHVADLANLLGDLLPLLGLGGEQRVDALEFGAEVLLLGAYLHLLDLAQG